MYLSRWVPKPIKQPLAWAAGKARRYWRPPPDMVVKANTAQAFNYFWRRRDFVNRWYLEPQRLRLYDLAADYCLSVMREMTAPPPRRIIDAGCGTGHFLQALHRRLDGAMPVHLEGFDFSRVAIRQARRLLPHARLAVRDVYHHSLPSDAYDLVICMETFEHLKAPDVAMRTLMPIVRSGGRMVITVPNGEIDSWDGHVNFWTPLKLQRWLESFGHCRVEHLGGDLIAQLIPAAASDSPRLHAA